MEKLLTPEEVSEILHIQKSTLAVWRSTGRYSLKYVRAGRLIMYKYTDVLHFIDSRTQEHT